MASVAAKVARAVATIRGRAEQPTEDEEDMGTISGAWSNVSWTVCAATHLGGAHIPFAWIPCALSFTAVAVASAEVGAEEGGNASAASAAALLAPAQVWRWIGDCLPEEQTAPVYDSFLHAARLVCIAFVLRVAGMMSMRW